MEKITLYSIPSGSPINEINTLYCYTEKRLELINMLMGYGFEGAIGWSGAGLGINTVIAVLIGFAAVWIFNAMFSCEIFDGRQNSNYEHHYAK